MKSSPVTVRTVTISSKGQFTIPKDIRDRLGIQPGDRVELWVEKGRLRARPLNAISGSRRQTPEGL
jgi:AbrB family looped-hinge helix DNA binding protein